MKTTERFSRWQKTETVFYQPATRCFFLLVGSDNSTLAIEEVLRARTKSKEFESPKLWTDIQQVQINHPR